MLSKCFLNNCVWVTTLHWWLGVIFVPGYQAQLVKPSLVNRSPAFPIATNHSPWIVLEIQSKKTSAGTDSHNRVHSLHRIYFWKEKKKRQLIQLLYWGLELQLISEEICQKKPTNKPPWYSFFHLTMKHTQRDIQEHVWNNSIVSFKRLQLMVQEK